MEHGAVLRDVDPVASEHRLGALCEPRFLGELYEERERLVADAVLRVVEVEARALRREAFAAGRVAGEQVAKVGVADLRVVPLERRPGGARAQRGALLAGTGHRRSFTHDGQADAVVSGRSRIRIGGSSLQTHR